MSAPATPGTPTRVPESAEYQQVVPTRSDQSTDRGFKSSRRYFPLSVTPAFSRLVLISANRSVRKRPPEILGSAGCTTCKVYLPGQLSAGHEAIECGLPHLRAFDYLRIQTRFLNRPVPLFRPLFRPTVVVQWIRSVRRAFDAGDCAEIFIEGIKIAVDHA